MDAARCVADDGMSLPPTEASPPSVPHTALSNTGFRATPSQSAIGRAAVAWVTPTVAAVSVIRAEAVRSLRAWSVDTQAVETNAMRASRRVPDTFIAVRRSALGSTEEAVRPGEHDHAVPESSGGFRDCLKIGVSGPTRRALGVVGDLVEVAGVALERGGECGVVGLDV